MLNLQSLSPYRLNHAALQNHFWPRRLICPSSPSTSSSSSSHFFYRHSHRLTPRHKLLKTFYIHFLHHLLERNRVKVPRVSIKKPHLCSHLRHAFYDDSVKCDTIYSSPFCILLSIKRLSASPHLSVRISTTQERQILSSWETIIWFIGLDRQ